MDFTEARWALEFLAWEGPGRATVQAVSAEDESFTATADFLRREQQKHLD